MTLYCSKCKEENNSYYGSVGGKHLSCKYGGVYQEYPQWIIDTAKEIDETYGELNIEKGVAEIILKVYNAAQQSVHPTPPTACKFCGHVPNLPNVGVRNPANSAGG